MKFEAPWPTANVPYISNVNTNTSNEEPAIVTVMPDGITTVALPYGTIPPIHVVVLVYKPVWEAVKLNELASTAKKDGCIYWFRFNLNTWRSIYFETIFMSLFSLNELYRSHDFISVDSTETVDVIMENSAYSI